MNEKQRLEKVLGWVNKVRREYWGLRPIKMLRKGYQALNEECPIHNSFFKEPGIGVSVGKTVTTVDGWGIKIEHPKYVTRFIEDFDNGNYPNLIKRG